MATMARFNVGPITNPAVKKSFDDAYLDGAGNGVQVLFDLAYEASYAGATTGAAPTAGTLIRDISGKGRHGTVNLIGSAPTSPDVKLPSYSGGGFNFGALTLKGSEITFPSSIAEHYATQTLGYYLMFLYVLLPASADWSTASSTHPLCCFANATTGWQAQAEIAQVHLFASGGNRRIGAQVANAGSYQSISGENASAFEYGVLNQIAVYKKSDGIFLRWRNAGRTFTQTQSTNSKSNKDLTGLQWHVGVGNAFWADPLDGTQKFKVFRGGFEDLEISGRDPVTVLNDDWPRQLARNVFS